MSTLRTKSGRKAGYYFPRKAGDVWRNGHPPCGTAPKRAGNKLANKASKNATDSKRVGVVSKAYEQVSKDKRRA